MSGGFFTHMVRARMAIASHVAKVPLLFCTELSAGALSARSLRARTEGDS